MSNTNDYPDMPAHLVRKPKPKKNDPDTFRAKLDARKAEAKEPEPKAPAKPKAKPAKKAKAEPKPKKAKAPAAPKPERVTKQDMVLGMLAKGATVPSIMKAAGWQHHTVRGFLSAVVRKKLGLNLISDGEGEDRVYKTEGAAKPKGKRVRPSKEAA